jgi:uncharacterized membrane protein
VLYVYSSVANVICQFAAGPRHRATLTFMILLVLLLLMKTFLFLRVFENFTPLVIMLKKVIYKLRIFGLFFTITLFLFSLLFSVIGVGLGEIQPFDLPTEKDGAAAGARRVLVDDSKLMMCYPHKEATPAHRGRALRGVSWTEPNLDIQSDYKYFGMFIG